LQQTGKQKQSKKSKQNTDLLVRFHWKEMDFWACDCVKCKIGAHIACRFYQMCMRFNYNGQFFLTLVSIAKYILSILFWKFCSVAFHCLKWAESCCSLYLIAKTRMQPTKQAFPIVLYRLIFVTLCLLSVILYFHFFGCFCSCKIEQYAY
jgi:hypothetical protein